MSESNIYKKVAKDMFLVQMGWTLGFLGVLLFGQVLKRILPFLQNSQHNHFFLSSFVASNVYMLIIGIIAGATFLSFYVQNGVSRKDFFKGAAIAGVGLSICIPVISAIVTLIEVGIVKLFNMPIQFDSPFSEIEFEDTDDLIGNIVESIIVPPFTNFLEHPILSIVVFFVSVLTFYFVGWFISATFIRLHWITGVLACVVSVPIIFIQKWFIASGFGQLETHMFSTFELPMPISMIAIVLLLFVILFVIRQLTKRVIIKL